MGNIVELIRRILTEKHQHSMEIKTNPDGSIVVFVGRRGLTALYEISKYLGETTLRTAMIATAQLGGNARFLIYDTDAVEIRLIDGFKYIIDETVIYSPAWRLERQEALHGH
jgi:hypothetical protein